MTGEFGQIARRAQQSVAEERREAQLAREQTIRQAREMAVAQTIRGDMLESVKKAGVYVAQSLVSNPKVQPNVAVGTFRREKLKRKPRTGEPYIDHRNKVAEGWKLTEWITSVPSQWKNADTDDHENTVILLANDGRIRKFSFTCLGQGSSDYIPRDTDTVKTYYALDLEELTMTAEGGAVERTAEGLARLAALNDLDISRF